MSSQEKTEKPTARQIRKARERGQVSQSRTVTATAILFGIGILGAQAVGPGWDLLRVMFHRTFEEAVAPAGDLDQRLASANQAMGDGAAVVAPLLLVVAVLAAAASFAQVGTILTFKPLTPKLSKLNPIEGLKKKFFAIRTFVELAKSVLIMLIVGSVLFATVRHELGSLARLSNLSPIGIALFTGSLLIRCFFLTVAIMAVLAVFDFVFQRWQGLRDLRMTKQQIKQEHKDQEGDPLVRSARRQLHEEISQQNTLHQAKKADVIVTNPDHLACALRFDPESEDAPRLIARGKNYLAEKIKEVARAEGIPITRDTGLAHALYELEIDQTIPEELYEAVAAILRWVTAEARARGETTAWDHLIEPPEPPGPESPPINL